MIILISLLAGHSLTVAWQNGDYFTFTAFVILYGLCLFLEVIEYKNK